MTKFSSTLKVFMMKLICFWSALGMNIEQRVKRLSRYIDVKSRLLYFQPRIMKDYLGGGTELVFIPCPQDPTV